MKVLTIDYLLEDEDLDRKTIERIVSKYSGYYVFIPKTVHNRLKRLELYRKYKLTFNVSNKYLIDIFKEEFNVKNRQAFRLISNTKKELENE